ncbi:VCBS repeat-containing protein [Acidobacteriia bacterium AH_259_A11_L15]|nr:VCBS repeat-containing protein [Acidobacteriia bacterium AH_259_A11_L15]
MLLPALGLFLLVGSAQQVPPPPEPIPTLSQEAPPRTAVEAIMERVETGKDDWVSEVYDEEVKVQLGKLKKLLAHPPLDREKLAELVAPEFRGAPLAPAERILLREAPPAVYRWELEENRTVTAETLAEELDRWLEGLTEMISAELKTVGVAVRGQDPPRVELPIRYSITGRTEEGEIVQRSGYWITEWRKDPERGWLWLGVTPQEGWEGRTPRPHFTDITACALPEGPAYQQLLRGADWWSAHVDVAAGVDIYGNNGVAMADIDGDGQQDFYVCQAAGLPNRLFRSKGDGTYEEIGRQAGVDALDRSSGAIFFDYDNDGDADLLVAGMELLLFRNDGRGHFEFQPPAHVGLTPTTSEKTVFTSLCLADYNRDGWVDIYVCSYAWQVGESGYNYPIPYHDANNGSPNFLFRNNGDGTFTDVTEEVGLEENNTRFSFACSWGDYNRDGWIDLYVANDFGRNNLYRNDGGRFHDAAPELGVEDVGAGMSVAWADYDNDGWLDLYVGNMFSTAGLRTTAQARFKPGSDTLPFYQRHAKGNTLFHNNGGAGFTDVTEEAGVWMGRWAWSSNFFDLDLDGYEDIFIANGFITNESTKDL